jgi:hypothetical protein
MNWNLKESSIISSVIGIVGLLVLALLSALGAVAFLNGILGASAFSTAGLIFGTLVILGVVSLIADYIYQKWM